MTEIQPNDLERFRSIILNRLGLDFANGKLGLLDEVLRRRLEACGQVCRDYLDRLESGQACTELGILAKDLTVGETYLFRHIDQFHAFSEIVLARAAAAQNHQKRLKILSAGAAPGACDQTSRNQPALEAAKAV